MSEAIAAPQMLGELPAELTTFVGRRFERSRVRELLSQSRLVTLTGFGGIGKTRLAMKVAADVRRAFPDGVCFVPLASISDADGVPDLIAGALGLTGRSTASGAIALVEYLRARTLLLILDNCEHVMDATAAMADTLLRTCPTLRILATTREPLRLEGEVVHAVAPLTCPPPGDVDDIGRQQFEAVQLFVDRAAASAPGFVLDDNSREAVAAICARLQGIPLAIELAAARLPAFSAAELERGLTDKWELLSRGHRTAPHRQSAMAACIEWSYDLCTPAERDLWAATSVFVDGFEHDAAVAVCSPAGELPIGETLAALVDKSVLAATRHGPITRFTMLPPIRQRGLAQLERMGESDQQLGRHRDFFLDLVDRAHDGWLSGDQLAWIDRVRREVGNIGEALERCAEQPAAVGPGLRACGQLLAFLEVQGLFRQGRRWCARLLAASTPDLAARAFALRTAGWLAALQGDTDSARALLDEGLSIAGELGGDTRVMMTQAAGLVAMYTGDLQEAEDLLLDAVTGFTQRGREAERAHCWMLLAILSALRGDADLTLARHEEGLALTLPAGETWTRSWSLWAASLAHLIRGDDTTAAALLHECLRLEQSMGESLGIGTVLETTGWIAAIADPVRAATLLGAAQNEWDHIEASIATMPGLDVRHSDAMGKARALAGQEAFERAWVHGRSLDQDSAIAFCLGEEPQGRSMALATRGHGILTRRELQVAELVHGGLSNQAIADRLVISPRTAETHVEHILKKLGFTSRTQVAAWFGEETAGGDDG